MLLLRTYAQIASAVNRVIEVECQLPLRTSAQIASAKQHKSQSERAAKLTKQPLRVRLHIKSLRKPCHFVRSGISDMLVRQCEPHGQYMRICCSHQPWWGQISHHFHWGAAIVKGAAPFGSFSNGVTLCRKLLPSSEFWPCRRFWRWLRFGSLRLGHHPEWCWFLYS